MRRKPQTEYASQALKREVIFRRVGETALTCSHSSREIYSSSEEGFTVVFLLEMVFSLQTPKGTSDTSYDLGAELNQQCFNKNLLVFKNLNVY